MFHCFFELLNANVTIMFSTKLIYIDLEYKKRMVDWISNRKQLRQMKIFLKCRGFVILFSFQLGYFCTKWSNKLLVIMLVCITCLSWITSSKRSMIYKKYKYKWHIVSKRLYKSIFDILYYFYFAIPYKDILIYLAGVTKVSLL